jgi:hypothetical protein
MFIYEFYIHSNFQKKKFSVFMCRADQMTTEAAGSTASNDTTPTAGPTTQPATQPTTQPASQPTTQPTTQPPVTVPSNETSTASNDTETTVKPATTEPPTTSEAPTTAPRPTTPAPPAPPAKSTYEVKEGADACLIMEGSFQLSVTYMKKDNTSVRVYSLYIP